jgi:hypothetical protein
MLIFFFLFGAASGIYNLLRGLNQLQEEKEKDEIENDE